jgi:hypothetical protein
MEHFQSKANALAFDPIALQDHFVCIRYYQETHYRQVDFTETIFPFQCIDVGALGAGITSAKTNITNLDMFDDEFGQFRIYPLDNVQVRLFEPAGVVRGQLKNIQVQFSPMSAARNPGLNLFEIFVWKDSRPAVEVINGSAYALNATRFIAQGYRFHTIPVTPSTVARIKENALPCTTVWCSGKG